MNVSFAQPGWLAAIPAVGLLGVLLFRHADRKRRLALQAFASAHLLEELTSSVSATRRRVKRALFSTGVLLILVALARPQWGFRWEEAKRKGIDLLVAVDVSKSMLAEDVKPSRLVRAKLAVVDLLDKLEGDRVGLIAFAGSSFLQCPLTLDEDAFRQSLDALDVNIIPRGGTDIASAIHEAESTFQVGNPNHKILILFTDGEDLEASGIEAAREAAKKGVRVFALGVGTANGELIPVPQENGGVDFMKDSSGQPVKSRLDESTLRQIAEVTGGLYAPLGQQNEGLTAIYEQGIASIPKQDLLSRMNRVFIERFEWPLGLALFCFIAEYLLSDRKQAWLGGRAPGRVGLAQAVALIFLMTCIFSLRASASPSKAERDYRQQQYEKAFDGYQRAVEKYPSRPELQFNFGAAAFKTGKYPDAAHAFEQALKTDRTELQQQAFYNLGNTQYRQGEQVEKMDRPQALQQWQGAVQSYEHALALKSNDEDAKFNLEFVKKKLEELQKQQSSDSSQKQDPKDSQEKEKNENQKSSSESSKPQNESGQKDPKTGEEKKKEASPKDSKPSQDSEKQGSEKSKSGEEHQASSQPKKESQEKKDAREAVRVLPGEMSKDDAEKLLNSMKSEEKKYPFVISEKQDEPPAKDW